MRASQWYEDDEGDAFRDEWEDGEGMEADGDTDEEYYYDRDEDPDDIMDPVVKLLTDGQSCKNCHYFRRRRDGDDPTGHCVNACLDEFDAPAGNGTDWCDQWTMRRNVR